MNVGDLGGTRGAQNCSHYVLVFAWRLSCFYALNREPYSWMACEWQGQVSSVSWGGGEGAVVGVGIDRTGSVKVMQCYMFLFALFIQMIMD